MSSRIEQLEQEVERLTRELEELKRRYQIQQAELESLHGSPAWRLILRYRNWLEANRARHRWVAKLWDPGVLWVARQLGLAGNSAPQQADYNKWIQANEPDSAQSEAQRRMSSCFSYRPKISVLVPVYRVPVTVLREAIDSVRQQSYDNWELCITVVATENHAVRAYLEEAAARDPRIHVKVLAANEGIAGNSNQALTMVTGEYLALLDHDDTLAPFALLEVVQLLNQDPKINFIYSDRDQISKDGKERLQPFFKPEWSPEVMLNANYVTQLCVMRTDNVRQVGGWQKETEGAQDWDLFLRLIHRFGNVRHIPKVLYHWRQIGGSVSSGGILAKPYAAEAQIRAVNGYCEAIGLNASMSWQRGMLRLEWPIAAENSASIVYLPRACSPLEHIDNAVRSASGQTLVFLDEAVTPIESDWLREITGPLQLPEIGMVGARLLDATTGLLRHCGLVFTVDGRVEPIYAGQPEHVSGPAGCADWYRNWSAVSGACFAVRREAWDAVGGFSGEPLHPRLDVHLCLKLRLQTHWRILYNPYARLLQSREAALEAPVWSSNRRLQDFFGGVDPYFNPNLDCRSGKVVYR